VTWERNPIFDCVYGVEDGFWSKTFKMSDVELVN
jgi:hypothetical protein